MRHWTSFLITICLLRAQSFTSGSTGSDGSLTLTTPGTIVFDPLALSPPLHANRDGICHFTSIYIAKNVTVRLTAAQLDGPVFWLSQGPVQIDGTIDISGTSDEGLHVPSAGAGGYWGGAPGQRGHRPEIQANKFLVPLVGGSGGDGGYASWGGPGGGALLIASSSSITVDGTISADGGGSSDGSAGAGGSIRLVAPRIAGSGLLSATGGKPGGVDGLIRFESFANDFVGAFNETPFASGTPFKLFLPQHSPASVRIVSIRHVAVTGRKYKTEDSGPSLVTIEARFVQPGTAIQVEVFPETGASTIIEFRPLVGTYEVSRATAVVSLPMGNSRAMWRR